MERRRAPRVKRNPGSKRRNIPTVEYQSVVKQEQQQPVTVKYPRNVDLNPQLVWRGKDQQDWSDLVVHAPPLYIQEKVHPKVLTDDLLRQTQAIKDDEVREPGNVRFQSRLEPIGSELETLLQMAPDSYGSTPC